MRITYLELENIKSYAALQKIEFTSGLNAVCGLNGSGKTTVLEAIGYALFNFIPYKQEAFVREGEKYGTIRVGLLARDEREYQVVRRVGSSGTYYVCDAETGSRLAERQDAVADWIREHALDMEADADLAALFKNAVGVPQGLMTADFLGTATTRKSIFDPLLRVEEYRKAWEYLRETESYLRNRTADVDKQIAHLEGETDKIPALEAQAGELRAQVAAGRGLLDKRIGQLEGLESQKLALDEIEKQLTTLQDELLGAEYDVKRYDDRLQRDRQSHQDAEAARKAVEEAEPGHQAVLSARERLQELETQSREREKLRSSLAAAQATAKGIFGAIERLDKDRAECVQASEDASALVDTVREQDTLDGRLGELQSALRDRVRLDAQIGRLREAIEVLDRTVRGRQERIAAAQTAREQCKKLPEVQRELDRVSADLAELRPLKGRLDALAAEGKQLKERHDRLAGEVHELDAVQRSIEESTPAAAPLDGLLAQLQDLREMKAHSAAALDYHQRARLELRRNQCPLLELQCPVVTADASMLDRFEERETALIATARDTDDRLAALAPQVDAARIATTALQKLSMEAARLGTSRTQIEEATAVLERCRADYRELADRVSGEIDLQKEQRRLQADVSRLQAQDRIAAELSPLEEQQSRDADVLSLQRDELASLEVERAALAASEEEARQIQKQLAELDDPRKRQQEKLAIAGRKNQIETTLIEEQERLKDASGQVKAITAALLPFEQLDDQIEEQRGIIAANDEPYERYVRHREEATQVEARREAVGTTTAALRTAEKALEAIRVLQEETRKSYDAQRHEQLRHDCEEVGRDVAREGARLEHLEGRLTTVEEELDYLRRQEDKLRARRAEREEIVSVERAVKFIRDTINQAGPAVTETLLRNISQGANDIFEEIMDDHAAELRWDKNYEVVVQRGSETRSFVQLSGGEQMSAALAVRLALLKEMSEVDFAFFDEPTQNMDGDRRSNLADQIRQVRGFEQLIVISHDDTFEHHTDNLIRLLKEYEETRLEV